MKYLSEVHGEGGIYAKCVKASITDGIPLYTLETKAPKFIDAEFEKHRMLSSNSSSSRAIPFKQLDDIYVPFDVRANERGMQGYEKISEGLRGAFLWDLKDIYNFSYSLLSDHKERIHKQHLNRYLEAFTYQKKVVTATEWDNFFNLRLAKDAQPEIQELARCMKQAIKEAEVTELKPGEWHLPYTLPDLTLSEALRSSVAGCARVSYGRVGGNDKRTLESDIALYDFLEESKHLTPFEHQATPIEYNNIDQCYNVADGLWWEWEESVGVTHQDRAGDLWSANFRGWTQYRQTL